MCVYAQSCPTLCYPMDCRFPGSSVHGIFRQEYWNRFPFPTPGGLPHSLIEPEYPASSALAGDSLPLSHQPSPLFLLTLPKGLLCGSVVKNLPANAGNASSILGSGRSSGEGNGNPLQYSCLGNFMDTGTWQVKVPGVAKELDMT